MTPVSDEIQCEWCEGVGRNATGRECLNCCGYGTLLLDDEQQNERVMRFQLRKMREEQEKRNQ